MATLSTEASDTIKLVEELNVLDAAGVNVLRQLFSVRVNEALVSTVVLGKETLLSTALFKVAASTRSEGVLGFVLRFTADLSMITPSIARAFGTEKFGNKNAANWFYETAYTNASKPGIANPALFMAATALRYATDANSNESRATAEKFLGTIKETLTNSMKPEAIEFSVHALSAVLRRRDYRPAALDLGLIKLIGQILVQACNGESAVITQLTYETLLCVWLLSFDYGCMAELHREKIIPKIHRVLQRAQKEKVIRLCLMVYQNFCQAQRKYYNARNSIGEFVDPSIYLLGSQLSDREKGPNYYVDLIGIGIMKTLWQLARRKFGDDDIAASVEDLTQVLDQNMDAVTSFSEYKGEVLSGSLEWSPVHTSTKFWKENATKFEENGYEALRELAEIIQRSRDDLTLAVACHDVGEIVRYHPSGRMILSVPQVKGLKEKVMGLMSHSNPEVAKNALVAVQKIMVQKWEFIQ
eukprot:GILI01012714.1.p1 GENE.GILI01012714.1~~GILI01012714.1.p1  ORF type:complete len:470 (-),score=133.76 GILI01012714.1:177-1586(-)